MIDQSKLVQLLQKEAVNQQKLRESRIMPSGLDPLLRLIARYPWQMLIISSLIANLVLSCIDNL